MPQTINKQAQSHVVPVHHLGISQIISFGMLFYAFAPLKTYVMAASSLSASTILSLVSFSMLFQALFMPAIGNACDKYGALRIMGIGFFTGAIGFLLLGITGHQLINFLPSYIWVGGCFVLIALGLGMSSYEAAFTATIQLDEKNARKKISIITFYGGVASTVSWLCLTPLLSLFGLAITTTLVSVLLCCTAIVIWQIAKSKQTDYFNNSFKPQPFHWSLLTKIEKQSLVCLATTGGIQYLMFSATTLLLISWFDWQYGNLTMAVILASICGPFQVIGRYIEMQFGHRIDARKTGVIAHLLVPTSLLFIQIPSPVFAVIAMVLFGMGIGVITVSYGFVTNLYFRAEVYGRAKSISAALRMIGVAVGPSLGGWLFTYHREDFMTIMVALALLSTASFALLLALKPTNSIHQQP